ncbi:MAG: 50S ribosome-binding GTPase [Phycisphaerae bacterium]|nr:50S ribosome-binding GTPase [Phycisphaerae bacterium]
MPANLTQQYLKAEQRYKAAGTDEERLDALEEMLREIPKHKGTEHLQADLKKRRSKLKAAIEGGGKKAGGGKHVDVFHVPKSGTGQVALVGMPNSGKSAIVAAMTNAHVHVADYPFTTDKPAPGMAKYEDVQIQLVDAPPITADFVPPGLVNTYRNADMLAIVIDLAGAVLEQMEVCTAYLDSHKLILNETKTPSLLRGTPPLQGESCLDRATHLGRKTFVIATKADIAPAGTLDTLKELTERPFEYIEVSAETGAGLDILIQRIFEMLDVVRVYAKKPGKEPDMTDPFTLKRGSNVHDLAYLIHRELADKLKTAKAWNSPNAYDGQNVPREHILSDKEIIELHFG